MFTFFKELFTDTKLNSYLFTLLLILTFVTWIPLFQFETLLKPLI